jgi:hypothetical protein
MGDQINHPITLSDNASLPEVIRWLKSFARAASDASARNLIQDVKPSGAALSKINNAVANQFPYFTGPTSVTLGNLTPAAIAFLAQSSAVFTGSGVGHSSGLVPDPGSVAASGRFLREDATWTNALNTGASNPIVFGRDADATTYNFISLSGFLTNAAGIGLVAGGGSDGTLYHYSIGGHNFRVLGADRMTLDASGNLVVNGKITSKTNFISVNRNGVNQTGISDNTAAKVQLNNKISDPDGVFDAVTNFRYTPNLAGTFLVCGTALIGSGSNILDAAVAVFKNGTSIFNGNEIVALSAAGISFLASTVSGMVTMNGTTDFLEMFVFCSSSAAGAYTVDGRVERTFLTAQRIGP